MVINGYIVEYMRLLDLVRIIDCGTVIADFDGEWCCDRKIDNDTKEKAEEYWRSFDA